MAFPRALLLWLTAALCLAYTPLCSAFYIPGLFPHKFRDGDRVPLYVNKIASDVSQLPYAYHDLPFVCPASPENARVRLNLGEVLRGDRIWESDYILKMREDSHCSSLCTHQVTKPAAEKLAEFIRAGYLVEWIVDGLPGATVFVSPERDKKYYAAGFPLGYQEGGVAYVNNHVNIILRYQSFPGQQYAVVGFEVYPVSSRTASCPSTAKSHSKTEPLAVKPEGMADDAVLDIPYTYSVYWREEKSVSWGNRWDLYFVQDARSAQIHWLAIVNSVVIVTVISMVVGLVFLRTLSRDIKSFRDSGIELAELSELSGSELGEEPDRLAETTVSGWKLLSKDVFRPPPRAAVLAALIGSGFQLTLVVGSTVILACIGVLSPSYRGGMMSFACFAYAFSGFAAGFAGGKVYKLMGGTRWVVCALLTCALLPGVVMSVVLTLNLFVWAQESSSALPFGTILAIFAIWLLISVPLTLAGARMGYKRRLKVVEGEEGSYPPVVASKIPRPIPPSGIAKFVHPIVAVWICGGPPFGVIFVELLSVFQSLWQEKSSFYYLYGFLALTMGLLVIVVVETAIIYTYFLLSSENHHWQWRSFIASTGLAWWVFAYSVYYFRTKLKTDGIVSTMLYFGYSALLSLGIGLFTGSLGFLAAWISVTRIYSAIKVD